MNAPVAVYDRRDPTGTTPLVERLATLQRIGLARWRQALYTLLVEQEALGLVSTSATTWPTHERLPRLSSALDAYAEQLLGSVEAETAPSVAFGMGWRQAQREAVSTAQPPTYASGLAADLHGLLTRTVSDMLSIVRASLDATPAALHLRLARRLMGLAPQLKAATAYRIVQAFNHAKLDLYEAADIGRVGVIAECHPVHDAPRRVKELLARRERGRAAAKAAKRRKSKTPLATILTAGDDKVCEECQDLEGFTYTLAYARRLLPVHPHCRCVVVPATDRRFAEVPRHDAQEATADA